MLAQNFKTAKDLGIEEVELDTLIKVLGMLEREEIPASLFDMHTAGVPEYGAPGCILGWARFVSGMGRNLPFSASLEELYYPIPRDWDPYLATRAQAAMTIRSYLATGEINWAEALHCEVG